MTAHPGFFGGSTVHGGRVRRLKANSFAQLVENYINVPVVINMTRPEFLADPDRDSKKDGAFLCPAAFPFDEGHRCDANASHCVLAIIDLDEGDFVRDFYESPETLADALSPLNVAVWTTAKHTPEAPRLKVVVEVEPCDPALHKRAVHHIIDRLGLPKTFKGLRESRTLSLPAYRPVQFLDEEFSAVVLTRTQSQALDATSLPEDSETEDLDRIYAMDGEAAASIAFLPVAGLKVGDIREPLFKIDPDVPYATWVAVACALRHQFQGDEDASREAYQLFDEWSATGTKYKGEQETFAKWRSFKPFAVKRAPITIRSLFKFAQDAGWVNTKAATTIKEGFHEWLRGCTDPDLIMVEAPKRISQLPFKNEVVEETLIVAFRNRLQELSGASVDKATLRKAVSSARFIERNEQSGSEMEPWLRPFTFVAPDNEFYNVSSGVTYSVDGFNNLFSRYLLPTDESENAKSGRPSVLPSHHALNLRKIKCVDGRVYDPRYTSEAEPFFKKNGVWYVNEYRANSVPKEEKNLVKKAKRMYDELMGELIGDEEYIAHITDFFAYVVQKPGHKIRHCILLQGAQGCGKGTLLDIVSAALGKTNVKIVAPGGMNSDFTDWKTGAVLVIFDEMKMPGKNRHEIANKLKDCITNDQISLNEKFKNQRVIDNVSNYVALTNFKDCIHLEETDRRFYPIFSPINSKEDVLRVTATGIFDRIHKLKSEHPGAFRSFFLEHTISCNFHPDKDAPHTRYRDILVANSKSDTTREFEDILRYSDDPNIGPEAFSEAAIRMVHKFEGGRLSHSLKELGWISVGGYWVHADKYRGEMTQDAVKNYIETRAFLLSEI